MSKRTVSADMAYPAEITITADDNGKVTDMRFSCKAHESDLPCPICDADEVSAFRRAEQYSAYVSADHRNITTFGGYPLARIKRLFLGKRRYTPTGGTYRMTYVSAESHGGVKWHGRYNSDNGNLITLHRSTASQKG